MAIEKVSSGIPHFDKLIDNLYRGDNVIWQVETGAFVELFNLAFVRASLRDKKSVIFVSFNNSPKSVLAKLGDILNNTGVTLVDCFTSGKGENSNLFLDLYKTTYKGYKCKVIHVKNPGDASDFARVMNEIEETNPRGARYVFDSITGMQDLWGGQEKILKFFTRQCPRLYELDTIAYWIVVKNAHTPEFREQLNHITQVAVDLAIKGGECNLTVIKAEKRSTVEMHKPHTYDVINSKVEFGSDRALEGINIGRKIREVRQEREISQANLAERIGVTPSTISQAENNAISLSLPALVKLARALDIPVGALFGESAAGDDKHFILKAKDRKRIKVDGCPESELSCELLVPAEKRSKAEAYLITMAPGAVCNGHFFVHKGDEAGFVTCGEFQLELGGKRFGLGEWDSIYLTSGTPQKWENVSDKPSRLLWVLIKS